MLLLAAPQAGLANGDAAAADKGRSRIASDDAAGSVLLLETTINGTPAGVLALNERNDRISVPRQTAQLLRLPDRGDAVELAATPAIQVQLDRPHSTIALQAPPALMDVLDISAGSPASVDLSPETWGAALNDDVNVRRNLTGPGPAQALGGLLDVSGFGPDLMAHSGWAYDSARRQDVAAEAGFCALVRLDSSVTRRPLDRSVSISIGYSVSDAGAIGRPYRFAGVSAGDDHSGQPAAWSSLPIPSVSGAALAASAPDVYTNGVRT